MNERRKKKKEEELRVIAELEQAMAENAKTTKDALFEEEPQQEEIHQIQKCTNKKRRRSNYGDYMPEKIHCRRCKTLMENGVCPVCGYKIYVPMDEKKREKIKLILAGVFIAVFVVVYVIIQISKS